MSDTDTHSDEDKPFADPRQQAMQDENIARRLERNPQDPDAQLDAGLDQSMDGSDPVATVQPGDTGEPLPSSGYDEAAEEKLRSH
jgi:hypothetical protein